MRKLVLIMLLATSIGFAQQPGATPSSKAKILTRAEFDSLVATPGSVLLLDVRSPYEIATNGGFAVFLSIQAAISKNISQKSRRTGQS